jgi:hypothetical protein
MQTELLTAFSRFTSFFLGMSNLPYAAHQMETADWHTPGGEGTTKNLIK